MIWTKTPIVPRLRKPWHTPFAWILLLEFGSYHLIDPRMMRWPPLASSPLSPSMSMLCFFLFCVLQSLNKDKAVFPSPGSCQFFKHWGSVMRPFHCLLPLKDKQSHAGPTLLTLMQSRFLNGVSFRFLVLFCEGMLYNSKSLSFFVFSCFDI